MEMSPRDNAEADASEPQPKRYQHIPLEVRSLVARFIVDHNHSAKRQHPSMESIHQQPQKLQQDIGVKERRRNCREVGNNPKS
jgi:hypothetical protein